MYLDYISLVEDSSLATALPLEYNYYKILDFGVLLGYLLWFYFNDIVNFLFFLDGIPICWQSCLFCGVDSCLFIVHGIVRLLYPEMGYCRRSWDSFADPCWS